MIIYQWVYVIMMYVNLAYWQFGVENLVYVIFSAYANLTYVSLEYVNSVPLLNF